MDFTQESRKDLVMTLVITAIFVAAMIGIYFYDQQTHVLEQLARRLAA